MDEKRLEELFGDQEFVDALKAAGKAEEVVRLFAANGVEVSAEGAKAFLADRDKASDGELSEDALDGVAGGITWQQIREILSRIPHGPIYPWRPWQK